MNDLKGCKVLVTPTSYGKTDPQLKILSAGGRVVYNPTNRPLNSAVAGAPGCDGFIAGLTALTGRRCRQQTA
jgi:hypothetical protein